MNATDRDVHRATTVVANRLPVQWHRNHGWRRAPGGLVTALSSLPTGSIEWIGSTATLDNRPAPPRSEGFGAIAAVEIDNGTAEAAVDGMANRTLWPALHGLTSRVRDREAYSAAYRRYNRSFAAHIAACSASESSVWVHDYHLLLVPSLVKSVRSDLTVGLSLHTPFDDAAMSDLAMSGELATALSRCDLIGVQTLADADQLSAFCARSGFVPPVVVSPVSIDAGAIDHGSHARTNGSGHGGRTWSADHGVLIVGVDRLDYTKGLLERVAAYDLAFARGDMCPDDVRLVQIAQPSRTGIDDYRVLRVELERLVHALNARWPRRDHTPVFDLRVGSFDRSDVLVLLAHADVAMVTPIRDGMNLVAKEFSIATERHGGVLVLSSMAGAAAELGPDSILVDGACPESVAAGLGSALRLDSESRVAMAQRRAAAVRAWTSSDWANSFLRRLGNGASDDDVRPRTESSPRPTALRRGNPIPINTASQPRPRRTTSRPGRRVARPSVAHRDVIDPPIHTETLSSPASGRDVIEP
ncbi:MAG: trehalose-6-phosphate synthase [Ilumatobacter sp.]|uniref:alpha,alpha-trehalose-phosphate synthase (UDP-forming) n=1 Tax=Ilumatobacter sp. TaxID=1967498 RepID=UPI003C785133